MDYTVLLTNISNNQLELINVLTDIKELIFASLFLFGIFFVYLFIRNMLKGS